jgi:hypothetical protein
VLRSAALMLLDSFAIGYRVGDVGLLNIVEPVCRQP